MSPQDYLDGMIRPRGYSTKRHKTLTSAYYNKPTALQTASYHLYLKDLVRNNDVEKFREIMSSGISTNACNQYGEGIVNLVCRLGQPEFLKILVENGCNLSVADDCGKTPLHDCCWAATPCFEVADIILKADRRLLHMTDNKDAVPLSYVHRDNWNAWIEYLRERKDQFWPQRHQRIVGDEEQPELTLYGANTRPVLNPQDSLTPNLAAMVVAGKLKPKEARFMMYDLGGTDDTLIDDSESSDYGDDDDMDYDMTNSSGYGYSDDESEYDEEEFADILGLAVKPQAV